MYTCRLIGRLDLSCVSFGQSVKPGEAAFCSYSSISIPPRFCRANQRESAAVAERGQSAGSVAGAIKFRLPVLGLESLFD